jgi:hypothetical protein
MKNQLIKKKIGYHIIKTLSPIFSSSIAKNVSIDGLGSFAGCSDESLPLVQLEDLANV